MRVEDILAPPCQCPECRQAGMTTTERRRDPQTGEWLHGFRLQRWIDARDGFFARARQYGKTQVAVLVDPDARFNERVPGEEG